ncbi:hypothetical protein [uncultured Methylovirgula sp.]|uniref:hypothetical protein n=1 Tax=uncultured Methylovirgula sp. TaxID=1285960 RepID=UPI00261213C3|nr:hypothetical protein [uncultured Methylovirgula sp.]
MIGVKVLSSPVAQAYMEFIFPHLRRPLDPLFLFGHILLRRPSGQIAASGSPIVCDHRLRRHGDFSMFDILYLAIGIAAFLVLTLYVYACDRL